MGPARCELRRARAAPAGGPGPAAAPGVYARAQDETLVARGLRRGLVAISFRPTLPRRRLAQLRAIYDEAPAGALLAPGDGRRYAVAVMAGARVLGCPAFVDGIFDAVRAFRARVAHRGPLP